MTDLSPRELSARELSARELSAAEQRDRDALDAAKLYYRAGLSQAEVAAQMGLSRPTVAKLLQHARERGFVVIEIVDPQEAGAQVGDRLRALFNLDDVRVVHPPQAPSGAGDHPSIVDDLGIAGARFLEEVVEDGMSVGVSWGKTMLHVARNLRHTHTRARQIVQLKGGSSRSNLSTNNFETMNLFCAAFNAPALALPLPVIFDQVETKHIVEQDSHIADVLNQGRETDLVAFTVGSARKESLVMNLGYLSDAMVEQLVGVAVGDVCSRFYTHDGNIAAPDIDALTVGISVEDLRARPRRVLIAGGTYKAEAIETALWMGLATDLVIDEHTARRVLALHERRKHLQK